MSLDRLQSKQGNFAVNPEPSYTVASSLSSIASNQLPGGLQVGGVFAVLNAASSPTGGGGFVVNANTGAQTFAASSGSGAMISHDNRPVVVCSLSAAGLHNLQPANYHGQMLTLVNYANVSGSLVTGAIISGQGSGSTTTAAVPTLTNAVTFTSLGIKQFIALSTWGGSASNSTVNVWSAIA